MLRLKQLDGTVYDKTAVAIERIKTMSPIAERIYGGYTVMVSGGKDSTVIADLTIRSGMPCKFETSWTGIEYPETVRFLRSEKRRIESLGYAFEFVIPRDREGKQITMWKLIAKRGFPTRNIRFCCQELKENASGNCYSILGVRWAESSRRKINRRLHEEKSRAQSAFMTNSDNDAKRRWSENCMKKREFILNPIIEWSDDEVWEYILERRLPYNPLYDSGHKRVGCIGCPMRANRKELEENPRYAALYRKAAERYLETNARRREGNKKDIESYYKWWVNFCGGNREYHSDITTGAAPLYDNFVNM
jgi:phosphoadenosine phosphosulfate reductase